MKDNPYQTPLSANVTTSGQVGAAAYQDPLSGYLVINKDFEVANICLFTGECIKQGALSKNVTISYVPLWLKLLSPFMCGAHPLYRANFITETIGSAVFLLIFGAVFVVSLAFSKFFIKKRSMHLSYSNSIAVIKSTHKKIALGLLILCILSLLILILDKPESDLHLVLLLGVILPPIGAVFLIIAPPKSLKVKKYKNGYFFVKGVHPSVLGKYPHLPDELA